MNWYLHDIHIDSHLKTLRAERERTRRRGQLRREARPERSRPFGWRGLKSIPFAGVRWGLAGRVGRRLEPGGRA